MKLLLFLYGWIFYNNSFAVVMLASDALLTNLPLIITAVCSGTAVVLGAVQLFLTALAKNNAAAAKLEAMEAVKISKENKADLVEVKKGVDGMTTKLLDAKDEMAKVISDAQKLKDVEKAAFNEGKLSEKEKSPEKQPEKQPEITMVVKEQNVDKQILKK